MVVEHVSRQGHSSPSRICNLNMDLIYLFSFHLPISTYVAKEWPGSMFLARCLVAPHGMVRILLIST